MSNDDKRKVNTKMVVFAATVCDLPEGHHLRNETAHKAVEYDSKFKMYLVRAMLGLIALAPLSMIPESAGWLGWVLSCSLGAFLGNDLCGAFLSYRKTLKLEKGAVMTELAMLYVAKSEGYELHDERRREEARLKLPPQ